MRRTKRITSLTDEQFLIEELEHLIRHAISDGEDAESIVYTLGFALKKIDSYYAKNENKKDY